MINCLIFTKNRACQLDLLLRSLDENFISGLDIHILAKATAAEYKKGYEKLIEKYMGKIFVWHWEVEGNFKDQVMAIVNNFDHDWTVCFCDDDVVLHRVDVDPYLSSIKHDINALSLRMGMNITHCYPKNIDMEQPDLHIMENGLMKWNWMHCRRDLDWGYPMSLGANIYRTSWLKNVWDYIDFSAPNYIEGNMAMLAYQNLDWCDRPFQISFTEQKVLNVDNNLVQDVCNNRYDDSKGNAIPLLNSHYLQGFTIDLDYISSKIYNSANGSAEYVLKK